MFFYDQTFTKVLPSWAYIVAGLFQWIYQTLDAVDGKHARKTKSSSPLGQLFDHGCDSFATSFLILSVCQMLRFGPTNEVLFFFNLVQFAFFGANWGEYHTGIMNTGVGNVGVTEGQFLIGLSLILQGIIGPNLFKTTVADVLHMLSISPKAVRIPPWILPINLQDVVLRICYVALIVACVYYVISTLIKCHDKRDAVSHFIPLLINMITTYLWSTLPVFQQHAALIMLISGLLYSLNTSRIIVCSLAKMKLPLFQSEFVVYFVGYLIAYQMFGPEWEKIDTLVLALLASYITVAAFIWARDCIEQIASFLGIYCLSLKKRDRVKLE